MKAFHKMSAQNPGCRATREDIASDGMTFKALFESHYELTLLPRVKVSPDLTSLLRRWVEP